MPQVVNSGPTVPREYEPLLASPSNRQVRERDVWVYFFLFSFLVLAVMITSVAGVDLTYRLICSNLGTDAEKCFESPQVGAIASSLLLYSNLIASLGGILVVPFLTAKSDKIGRKPLFLYGIIVILTTQCLQWWLVFGTNSVPHYYWTLVPTVVSTIGGGVALFSPLTVSYISDTFTDSTDRAKFNAHMSAVLAVAVTLGPSLGSSFAAKFGLGNLYLLSITLIVLLLVATKVFLVESLSGTQKELNSTKEAQSFASSCAMLLFNNIEDPQRRLNARIYTASCVLGSEFSVAVIDIIFLYIKNQFGWTSVESGYWLSGASIYRFFAYTFIFPALLNYFSSRWTSHAHDLDRTDMALTRISLGFYTIGYFLNAFAKTPKRFIISSLVESSSSFGSPIYNSALVKYAPEGHYGAFMGSFSLVQSISAFVVPSLMLKIYGSTIESFSGAAFLVASTTFAILFGLTFIIKAKL